MISKTFVLVILMGLVSCDLNPSGGEVVARVNKTKITVSQLQVQADKASQFPGTNFSLGEQKQALLHEMIRQELLFQAALKENIFETTPRLKQEIAAEYLRQKMSKIGAPTEKEISVFMELKKNELVKVRASHILIRPKDTKDPKSWEEAKSKAEDILKKMKGEKSKLDFAKYAREYSEDGANKNSGGDLNFFTREQMVPTFGEAAFALKKVGDLSDVVKTDFGYHIIQLTGDQREIEAQKPQLLAQLAQQKQAQQVKEMIENLEKNARVSIENEVLTKTDLTRHATQTTTSLKK